MRKFRVALAAALAAVSLTALGSGTPAYAATCHIGQEKDTVRMKSPYVGGINKWVDATVKINYKRCVYVSGKHRIKFVNWTASYNAQGTSESCGVLDRFEGVRFNLYLKDGTGANYHPSQKFLPCEKDTTGSDTWSLKEAPVMRYCSEPPRWKANTTMVVSNNKDQHGSMNGFVWNFTGPVPNDC